MTRKIKFRGKCAGTWRRGDHLTYKDADVIKAWMGSISPEYTVESESVGQFTGFYDRDGKEIYEGDICEYKNNRFYVKWNKCCGRFEFVTADGLNGNVGFEQAEHIRIVGNIFDNPEFLKGE